MTVKQDVILELEELAKMGVRTAKAVLPSAKAKPDSEFDSLWANGMRVGEIADFMMVL